MWGASLFHLIVINPRFTRERKYRTKVKKLKYASVPRDKLSTISPLHNIGEIPRDNSFSSAQLPHNGGKWLPCSHIRNVFVLFDYHNPTAVTSEASHVRSILNALGIIAVVFRGHNVVLEIQGTMPSNPSRSSSKPMWKGIVASYLISIVGYWSFGNKFPSIGGLLTALSTTLHHHMSKPLLGLIYVQVVISCVTAFQIYSMVVYDNLERAYVSRTNHECSKFTRMAIRIIFGGFTFFISVAFPFLQSLSLLVGGIALHLTFGYPSLMWLAIKRPPMKSARWWLNFMLGCLGTGLSVLVIVGAVWNLVCRGLDANFFHPR
ncbi:lysine histidine transporter-like 8 protein [Tanacetum coccineum]